MVSKEAAERSLVPQDTPLEVSRYVVEGEGPQGTTFSVMSTTQNLEVEGLLIGNWTITAVGQNSNGVDLVTGQATVNLIPEPSPVTIELDSLAGKGLLSIQLAWNALNVSDPSLQVNLTDEQGNTQVLQPYHQQHGRRLGDLFRTLFGRLLPFERPALQRRHRRGGVCGGGENRGQQDHRGSNHAAVGQVCQRPFRLDPGQPARGSGGVHDSGDQ
jgi:hypothetical protein